jgi:hypothetical protein
MASGDSVVSGESQRSEQTTQQYMPAVATWIDRVKRIYILLLAIAAVVFSVMVVFSCEFFSYRSLNGEPWEGLVPPFDSLAGASVGLFSYSETIVEESIQSTFMTDGSCIEYEDPLDVGQNDLWRVAQYCSMVAPVAGFLAFAQLILEMIFCRLRGSSLLITLLFFGASGLQGCTFMIFTDREFW